MAAQFDLYEMAGGQMVVVLQNDLLEGLGTRVVAPMMPADGAPAPMKGLNPVIELGQGAYVLMPQLMATLTRAELGTRRGSLAHHRDRIARAFDMVWTGV